MGAGLKPAPTASGEGQGFHRRDACATGPAPSPNPSPNPYNCRGDPLGRPLFTSYLINYKLTKFANKFRYVSRTWRKNLKFLFFFIKF